MKPFLKWAGGKRWLAKRFPSIFSIDHERYVEPFFGGGAIFFDLQPRSSIISDKNAALMNVYSCVRDDWVLFTKILRRHARGHSDEYYYKVRSMKSNDRFERAAKFVYLNRTCWNGLYRENLRGEFNVPRGTKNTVLMPDDDFERVAEVLKFARIQEGDFEGVLSCVTEGDLVFVDPPYTVRHNNNGFLKYNETIFSWHDQERLALRLRNLTSKGANIIVCNAYHESVVQLYADFGDIMKVERASVLAGDSRFRSDVEEAVILAGAAWDDTTKQELRASMNRAVDERKIAVI